MEIANVFNNLFTTIGPDLANNIKTHPTKSVHDYLISRNKKSMFLSPVDECEVISVVNGCKSKTSTDCDVIDFTKCVYSLTVVINLLCLLN